MTLDQRIDNDLKELYNNGEISGAVALGGLVQEENEGVYWVDEAKGTFTPQEETVINLLKSNSGISIEQLAVQAQMTVAGLETMLGKLKKNGCDIRNEISFATRALPVYTVGKRGAKTVMVMLNPGKGVKASNNDLLIELKKRSMFTMLEKLCCGVNSGSANLGKDIANYHYLNTHYGDWDYNRQDGFDLKQAFFLRDWPGTGINLPKGLCANSSPKEKLAAKESVLDEKQQLELIPYASRKFDKFNPKMIKEVFPYVETLLEEIFSADDRKYVIFCSAIFEDVFKAYSKTNGKITFVDGFRRGPQGEPIRRKVQISYTNKKGQRTQQSLSCTLIELAYGNNKPIQAIIANTFPKQDITNAYKMMAAYGKFCYECYCGMHSSNQPHKITLP